MKTNRREREKMNYQDLANLIFPEANQFIYMKKNIKKEIYQKVLLLLGMRQVQQVLYI